MNPIPVKLRSTDGKTVRVEFDSRTLSTEEARDFASELMSAVSFGHSLPSIHDRHVNLQADCALCVYEAGAQTDRLTYDEPPTITPERFLTLAAGKWVQAELTPKNGRKRTVRGDLIEVNDWPPFVYERGDRELGDIRSITIHDKAGRYQTVDIPLVDRLVTGGENSITLVERGELAPDYRLASR